MDGYLNEKRERKAMLHLNRRLYILLMLLIFSCESKRGREAPTKDYQSEYETKLNTSISIVGDSVYKKVYKNAVDTITFWVENKIPFFARFKVDSCKLDSLICFNTVGNKAIMARLSQCRRDCTQDDVHFFYGVKIKERWYFFSGPTMVIIRDKEAIHTPTSFTKLHEIAMGNIFKGYLKKNEKGEWEINDGFFKQLDYSQWGFFDANGNVVDNSKLTQAQLDSHLLAKAVFSNGKHRDTTHYQPLP